MIKRLFKLFAIFITLSSMILGWYWYDYKIFLQTPIAIGTGQDNADNLTETVFIIDKGASVRQIARLLHQQGLIEHPEYFRLYTRFSDQAAKIKAGEYTLTSAMTIVDAVKLFVSGKVNQYSLTLVEGWTVKQALEHVLNDPILIKTLDDQALANLSSILNSPYPHPEGMLYPDTYHFPRGTTDLQFIQRAHQRLLNILDEEWRNKNPDLPLKTPYEALILASIVEKETGISSERDKIAGVFIRRLTRKMRLQSDPTIIYGMGERYQGNIRKRDINEKTAYNTYQIDGLPPTPIAIAGRNAIHAVLHPDKGKSLYFVADGSGGHHFSNSLQEHNKAVRQYILKK